jgi:4-cresol dehydrogenase (hydroxylating) flavoprotein subunit
VGPLSTGKALEGAIERWTAALGRDQVIVERGALEQIETATFATSARVGAILRPTTRQAVQDCVRIANEYRVPLYPTSTGKNWGYGSGAPVRDSVLLDLRRMNRICECNEELAYVTVEPGVTQRQLYTYLRERNSNLWMDATGASPDCSIIGNTLERGFGHTPMGDHCGQACAFEVVLPNGECVDTGFGRFPGADAAALGRWGLGPSLDGLFSQSNFGIVTRMSVWLMPKPEHFQAFFFSTRHDEGLSAIVDAVRPLRLNGTLRSVMHIGNDYKVVAATGRFPWTETQPPLGDEAMHRLRKELGVGGWTGSGGLYGTRAQVRAARRELRRVLAGKVHRLTFLDDRLLGIIGRGARPLRRLTGINLERLLVVVAPVYGLLKGVPTDDTMSSTYWRKRPEVPVSTDPDRDRCGLLWCSPVVPATGQHIGAVTRLAREVTLRHGFEPQMSVSLATERSLICVTTISYDRALPGEDERAYGCYTDLTERLLAAGYPPYRLNVRSMHYVAGSDAYGHTLNALKAAIDPHHILAPGRYEPGSGTPV